MNIDTLVIKIKESEGFVGTPYEDTEGFSTIGFGTKLPITRHEGTVLLRMRLENSLQSFADRWPVFYTMPEEVQSILAEMVYQMGANGVLGFKRMLKHLYEWEFKDAAAEGRNSRWYRQTTSRAEKLMARMENIVA